MSDVSLKNTFDPTSLGIATLPSIGRQIFPWLSDFFGFTDNASVSDDELTAYIRKEGTGLSGSVGDLYRNAINNGALTTSQLIKIEQGTRGTQPISEAEIKTRTALIQSDAAGGAPNDTYGILENIPNPFDGLEGTIADKANVLMWGAALIFVVLIISILND